MVIFCAAVDKIMIWASFVRVLVALSSSFVLSVLFRKIFLRAWIAAIFIGR
jgi:hypothetical protein